MGNNMPSPVGPGDAVANTIKEKNLSALVHVTMVAVACVKLTKLARSVLCWGLQGGFRR